jgi:hypothetical protein
MTFKTVAKPGDPVRTSAGYDVLTTIPGEGSNINKQGLPIKKNLEGSSSTSQGNANQNGQNSTGSGSNNSASKSDNSAGEPSTTLANPTSQGDSHGLAGAISSAASSVWIWVFLGLVALLVVATAMLRRRPPAQTAGPTRTADKQPVNTPDRRP